ncbi:MAG: hypothetical protein MJZ69_07425 [Bacteroidaceae bacterium]|nr:hypothetical protein [Bacteroidaceae bacterium]
MSKYKFLKPYLPYLLKSIYFNFKFLPFKQAIKLPILLAKPHFIKLKGKVRIEADYISTGMIRMGALINTCNPNNGITFDINGTIIFKGRALFANDSYIMIRDGGVLTLGKDLDCNCKIKCAKSIEIGDETWIAYDSMIMDSDWHALTDVTTGKLLNRTSPVKIGKHNFISYKCIVSKGTITPDNATFMPCSTLNKVYEEGEYPLFGGNPCEMIDEGYYMDHNNN